MESNSGRGTELTLAQAREMLAADLVMTINERALLVLLTDLEKRFNLLEERIAFAGAGTQFRCER